MWKQLEFRWSIFTPSLPGPKPKDIAFACYQWWSRDRNLQNQNLVQPSVSNPGFPEPETRFFGYYWLPETRFFSTTKPGY